MELYISNSGQEPIYAQITRQIKAKILNGELQQGDALPSIRLLAKELRISVITTKRAYEDLEADGLITTMPGRGSFAAPQNPALHREESLKQMEEHLQHAIDAARRGGITKDEVRETLDLLWEAMMMAEPLAAALHGVAKHYHGFTLGPLNLGNSRREHCWPDW